MYFSNCKKKERYDTLDSRNKGMPRAEQPQTGAASLGMKRWWWRLLVEAAPLLVEAAPLLVLSVLHGCSGRHSMRHQQWFVRQVAITKRLAAAW